MNDREEAPDRTSFDMPRTKPTHFLALKNTWESHAIFLWVTFSFNS